MKIIDSGDFDAYWEQSKQTAANEADTEKTVRRIIEEVRNDRDAAVRRFASQFDKSSPECFEVPRDTARSSWERLRQNDPVLAQALEVAAGHITDFARRQRSQFTDFEYEMAAGLWTGQKVIPVGRAAVYVPAGRFPLISSALMGIIPALVAGVDEVCAVSPPLEDGLPDWRIMAAAHLAGAHRLFAVGGAQAIAALALGTETIPQADIIAGPGNKYIATAKRLLSGEVGIDFVAGPTDVLVIADESANPDLIAADMLAQAEHDPDARARALVKDRETAARIGAALERRLALLPTEQTARASLNAGGLIVIYHRTAEAVRIANTIAPEHLELSGTAVELIPRLKNYGALFIGEAAAEVLGDYSAGTNHTLPTSGSARFSGGLSVRHFLKTVTTLRCMSGEGYDKAVNAAAVIAKAEGLIAHSESAAARRTE